MHLMPGIIKSHDKIMCEFKLNNLFKFIRKLLLNIFKCIICQQNTMLFLIFASALLKKSQLNGLILVMKYWVSHFTVPHKTRDGK